VIIMASLILAGAVATSSADFQVIELRRYECHEAGRAEFARYFESYFPEAFQQLGSLIFGSFLERGNAKGFVWIRGFHDMPARATVNQAFYAGPLWKEHSRTMNERLIDHRNVLLLQPLAPGRGIAVLPAVDPVREAGGARGLVIAQILPLPAGRVDAFAAQAEPTFTGYRSAGAREAAVLVTLDAPDNFPSLPFRTDGPFLVWLGVVEDERMLQSLEPLAARAAAAWATAGLLRGAPELVVLEPSNRSRLRWRPEWP
jgi:hypothetical protein